MQNTSKPPIMLNYQENTHLHSFQHIKQSRISDTSINHKLNTQYDFLTSLSIKTEKLTSLT